MTLKDSVQQAKQPSPDVRRYSTPDPDAQRKNRAKLLGSTAPSAPTYQQQPQW